MRNRLGTVLLRLAAGLVVAVAAAAPINLATVQVASAQGAPLTCATISQFNFDPVPAGTVGATRTENVSLNAGDVVTVTWGGLAAFFWSVNGTPVPGTTGAAGSVSYTVTSAAVLAFFKSVTGGPGFVRFTCTPASPAPSPTPPTLMDLNLAVMQKLSRREPKRYEEMIDFIYLMFFGADPRGGYDYDFDYVDTPTNAPARAIDELYAPDIGGALPLFFFGDRMAQASIPIGTPDPGWNFNLLLDGAIHEGSWPTLSERTTIGTATFTGAYRLDDETIIAGGLKVGAAQTSFTTPIVGTVDTTMVGIDFAVARILMPELYGAIYGGFEFNQHHGLIGGVTSDFPSHLFKIGANLQGRYAVDEFVVIPDINALLQYRHTPAFTDSAGTTTAAFDMLELDTIAGVRVERTFVLTEHDLLVTPFAGLNLWGSYAATTVAGATLPYDPLMVQAVAGVRFVWGGGLTAEFQGDIARGANSTMIGASATVSAPIN